MKPEETEAEGLQVPTIGEQMLAWLLANPDYVHDPGVKQPVAETSTPAPPDPA